jgi:Protein of unknown function (DUF3592)
MSAKIKFDFAIFIALFFAMAIVAAIVSYKNLIFSSNFKTTTGIIEEKIPENHLGFNFSYKVDGKNYSGSSYAGQIGRQFEQIQLGDSVTVFYEKNNPANQILENPQTLFVRTVGQIIAASLIIPFVGLFIFRRVNLKN